MPRRLTQEEFIERARKVHGNTYDYSKVKYINNKTPIIIICPVHGEFSQKPNDHLSGCKCKYCYGTHKLSNEEFIEKARKVHGDKYDYSKVKYDGALSDITIICPDHGEFLQNANNHLNGCGCPKCSKIITYSKMSEKVFSLLSEIFSTIEKEKTFNWLKFKRKLKLDFFIPDFNIAVEVQGEQHFQPSKKFGGIEEFTIQQQRDLTKKKLCEKHGIKLFYITKRNFNIDEIKEYINEATNKENTTNKENK